MSVIDDVKPFPVVKGEYLFYFTPAEEGGFSVTCQNVFGVNAQGDTFEDALENAVSMAAFVRQCRRELAAPKPERSPSRAKRVRKSAR